MEWLLSAFISLTFICLSNPFYLAHPSCIHAPSRKNPTAMGFERQVIVVGGGIGGLAVASRMSSSTDRWKVTILEKNSNIGGRCGSFVREVAGVGTFRHERGPSLLLLPDVYQDIFRDCASQDAKDFGLMTKQCVPAYQVVFEDGDSIEVGFPRQPTECIGDSEITSREKMNSYEHDGAKKWDEYMRATGAFLDAGLSNFIEERLDLASFPKFLQESLRDFAKSWPLKPHSDVLNAIFESEKLKALASFQDLYVGLEPYRNNAHIGGGVLKSTAPAVFGLLAAIELHPSNSKSGVFAPIGGFQAVTEALRRLAESLGVTIECNTMVTSIHEDGVLAIDTSSPEGTPKFLPADLIVVNADLPYATKSLVRSESLHPVYDWDDQFSFSSGVISFHWSVAKPLHDLNTHNVFLIAGSQAQAERSWDILRTNEGETQGPFNFYVHRAGKTDPSAAPEGSDSIMVLVPCRTLLRDEECAKLPREQALHRYREQFCESTIQKVREAVLERLGVVPSLQDLKDEILDEVVDTPATWAEQFHLAAGTPFALSHGFAQLSLARPSHYCREIPNVLFCGASTRPGNGVPLVLIGAKQVSEKAVRILEGKLS